MTLWTIKLQLEGQGPADCPSILRGFSSKVEEGLAVIYVVKSTWETNREGFFLIYLFLH